MGCSELLILAFVLKIAYCLEILDVEEKDMEIDRSVTGILGEDVYLRCRYLGQNDIVDALWKRQSDSRVKTKRLTGYNGKKAFNKDTDFSVPASPTNLTVRMNISSLEVEGQYTCTFVSDEEDITDSMTLTVLARPEIQTLVTEDADNGTHYQSVTCSVTNGKPTPRISWEINGRPPTDDSFSVEMRNTTHPNGTSTVTSVLRFPTHLQDQDSVTCVVRHPTLPDPTHITVGVVTFVAPSVSIETRLVGDEGRELWEVTCRASGGRPRANITLALSNDDDITFALPNDVGNSSMLQREDGMGTDTWVTSYPLPVEFHEGNNITCMFDHPMFTPRKLRTVNLPRYYLSAIRLLSSGFSDSNNESQAMELMVLEEGQDNATIRLEVIGDVPHYSVVCTKDAEPLPEGVEVTGSAIMVWGPVELRHAGLYECEASYNRHRASLLLDITVKQPVAVPPSIRVGIQERLEDSIIIECLAADALPAANVSWVLPEGVSRHSWSNFTSHNGTHSITSVLVLPVCLPQELSVECVVDHPVFQKPESRRITLHLCDPPNITIQSRGEWEEGTAYTLVLCRVDSDRPAATISWRIGDRDSDETTLQLEGVQEKPEVHANGSVTVHSTVRVPTATYSGQFVTCVVEHLALGMPEGRDVLVPGLEAPVVRVFVRGQRDSPLWLAVCEYSGGGLAVNLSWVLPENTTGQTTLHSEYEGMGLQTKLTYEFPLVLHEGQDLTCLIKNDHGLNERRTVHVPQYYISSLRVLNQTTPLQGRPYGDHLVIHRLALQENLQHQKILLRVYGSVPTYNLTCLRSDGSLVQMEGTALIIQSKVTEREAGLYTCHASFYHHQATVLIQVEITSEDKQLWTLVIVCLASATAIAVIVIVAVWVFCKINGEERVTSKKQESLAALTCLLQDSCSPDLRKTAVQVGRGGGQEYAQLVSYSIVIDVKSTV